MTIALTRSGEPETKMSRNLIRRNGPRQHRPNRPEATGRQLDGTVQHIRIGDLQLESGVLLPDVVLGYETWGTLNADGSNAVLIEHALTGDTHVTRGASEEPGWWEQLAGPGAPVDTDKYFVVSINILGGCYGSTGPSTPAPDGRPWGSRFPLVTLRDTTAAEARLADALGIGSWYAVLGGSLGGARALEWAVTYPEQGPALRRDFRRRLQHGRANCFRTGPDPGHPPGPAFDGGNYYGGPEPEAGLALARRIAHITYRSAAELDGRFGRNPQEPEAPLGAGSLAGRGRYQVESYLDHQGNKLVRRFDANSYIAITEALMSHDVCRGRGSLRESLAPATAEFLVAAVDSDRLYFPAQTRELAEALPGGVEVHMIAAPIGHDGFLTEIGQLSRQLRETFFGR